MSLSPSSPRLPSPPPPAEIQIGPKSPAMGDSFNLQEAAIEQSILDANSNRRIHPGTKAADMAAGPPLVPLNELDSAFQLQEHLKALHHEHTKSPDSDHTIPITRETAALIAAAPEGVDKSLWLYELCRFLINKCNDLIVGFLFDDPPCSATTCPEMRASEWQFLCAVHDSPKSCCAIDYCCHTLDWATKIVTSQKIFPSRLSLDAGEAVDDKSSGVKHLVNIFRRLHRIFAHAWFQHKGVFWHVEGQTGLYVLFKTVCDTYDLLPAENYKLPPEAEGLDSAAEQQAAPTILRSDSVQRAPSSSTEEDNSYLNLRTNTRRHIRSSPSTGSAVTTVIEADEEESDQSKKLNGMQVVAEEAPEPTSIPEEVDQPDAHPEAAQDSQPASDVEPEAESEETAAEDPTPAVDGPVDDAPAAETRKDAEPEPVDQEAEKVPAETESTATRDVIIESKEVEVDSDEAKDGDAKETAAEEAAA